MNNISCSSNHERAALHSSSFEIVMSGAYTTICSPVIDNYQAVEGRYQRQIKNTPLAPPSVASLHQTPVSSALVNFYDVLLCYVLN